MSTHRSIAPSQAHGPHLPHFVRTLAENLLHEAEVFPQEVTLAADGVHSVHVGHRMLGFAVLEGEVLVTVEGDVEDHVVEAGETFHAVSPRHHVIAALRPSRVRIEEE